MSGIFSKPSPPPPPPPPPVPTLADPAVEDARKRAQRAARNARGRAATILTDGQGVVDATRATGLTGDPLTTKKTLLGA